MCQGCHHVTLKKKMKRVSKSKGDDNQVKLPVGGTCSVRAPIITLKLRQRLSLRPNYKAQNSLIAMYLMQAAMIRLSDLALFRFSGLLAQYESFWDPLTPLWTIAACL